jgi:hypothetical protein
MLSEAKVGLRGLQPRHGLALDALDISHGCLVLGSVVRFGEAGRVVASYLVGVLESAADADCPAATVAMP